MKKYLLVLMLSVLATPSFASVDDLILQVKRGGLTELETLLSQNGEDVNAKNSSGNTALHYAVATKDVEMVTLLLSHGAKTDIKNNKGWSPLMIAEKKNLNDVVNVMKNYSKDNVVADVTNVASKTTDTVKNAVVTTKDKVVTKVNDTVNMAQKKIDDLSKTKETAEQLAKKQAEELAKKKAEAEQLAKKQAEELAKKKAEAEQLAKKQAEELAKKKAEAEQLAKKQAEAEAWAKEEAERIALKEAEEAKERYMKNLEVVYCLNFLGLQTDEPNMMAASSHYAVDAGLEKKDFDLIEQITKEFYESNSSRSIESRIKECSEVITPKNAEEQNKIIRSLNKSIGF